jgi:hypothetical protein
MVVFPYSKGGNSKNMEMHFDRLKVLLKKRSLGGWLLLILGVGWQWLEHLHTAVWVVDRLFPEGRPRIMFHPNYITFGLFILGLLWLSVVLLWRWAPSLWLEYDASQPYANRPLRIQNSGRKTVYNVVVKIPADGSDFVSDCIPRLLNDTSWIACTSNGVVETHNRTVERLASAMLMGDLQTEAKPIPGSYFFSLWNAEA